jgi:serine phosphatase RsbU (regulator of sigma subunit)
MLVSLLVGALHALALSTTRPAELLSGLNQSVRRRSSGGFTTCLILRLLADGSCIFANAGHIAPYLNGVELTSENGLPLGLVADAMYSEASLHISQSDQITLLTDGVVEARSKSGELFGFERTAAISAQSAESMATHAQEFGQDDDITVLTVRNIPILKSERDEDSR